MAEAPTTPGGGDWTAEQWRALLRTLNDKFSAEEIWSAFQMLVGATHGTFWVGREAKHKEMMTEFKQFFRDAATLASAPAADLVNSIFGIPISAGDIASVAGGGSSGATRKAAGDAIVKLIFSVFDINAVREGYLNRLPGGAEADNFGRFVGINWQLQIADLVAGFVKDAIPWGLADGIQDVGEALQKILGLEDAQEEILEPFMEKLIVEGINKQFNRETKPVDYTPNDAIGAFIQGLIGEQEMHAVLDNEGVRQGIRANLINMQAKNLTHADLVDLYQRGVWNQEDIAASIRGQGYQLADARLKATIVASDRQWKLAYQLADVYEQQFVKSVIQEGEYEGYLRQVLYTADEVSILLETARRKKTLATKALTKRITGSFNITPERVKEGASAIIKWNIRNADSITITDLGSVGPRGEQPLEVPRSRTYELHATNDIGDDETFYAYVEVRGQPEVKPPTATLTLSPRDGQIASLRELRWSTTKAESVTLDGVPVALDGVQFVTPVLPTFYTLRATNAAGTVTTQDVALVSLPELPGDLLNRPKVSFSVSPLVIDVDQPRVEIKWDVEKSDSQSLTFPDGHTISTDQHGARIEIMGASGIFTFAASNTFGRTIKQEAVLFKGEPFPTP